MHGGWHELRGFDAFKASFQFNIQAMRCVPPSAIDLLYPPKHLLFQEAFEALVGYQPATLQGSTVNSIESTLASKKRSPLLCGDSHLECRDSTRTSARYPPLNYRKRKILADQQHETRGDGAITFYDVSQSLNRIPRSSPHPRFPQVTCAPTI